MKFDQKEDPLVKQQKAAAQRENIDAIRAGVREDTDLKNRIFGGNMMRKMALGRGLIGNG